MKIFKKNEAGKWIVSPFLTILFIWIVGSHSLVMVPHLKITAMLIVAFVVLAILWMVTGAFAIMALPTFFISEAYNDVKRPELVAWASFIIVLVNLLLPFYFWWHGEYAVLWGVLSRIF